MRGKPLVDYAVYLGVRVVIAVVQTLPLDACDQLSSALATLCSRWLRIRFRVSDENLQAAYPTLTAAEEAAKRTIEEEAVFRVSVEDQRRLLDALSKPARPTAALRKAYKLSSKLIAPE